MPPEEMVRLPSGALVPRRLLRLEAERRSLAKSPVHLSRSVAGVEPDAWQVELLTTTRRRVLLNCSRQVGKSTMAGLLALHTALFRPGSLTLMVAPSLRQSRELFRKTQTSWEQLLDWGKARGLPYMGPELIEDNALSLAFAHPGSRPSRIVALPANATTVRGFSAVDLYLEDEAATVPDNLYRTARPMLITSKGRAILLSSPFGKRGHFYEAWERGGPGWLRIEVPATKCSRIPKEDLDEERRELGAVWFEQEYMCRFVDLSNQVFTTEMLEGAMSDKVYSLLGPPAADDESPWEVDDGPRVRPIEHDDDVFEKGDD